MNGTYVEKQPRLTTKDVRLGQHLFDLAFVRMLN